MKKKTVQAKSLTPLQLKMLDIGAPVVVSCKTLTGETVDVRLQTGRLDEIPQSTSKRGAKATNGNGGHKKGCWVTHGAYVAIMPRVGNK